MQANDNEKLREPLSTRTCSVSFPVCGLKYFKIRSNSIDIIFFLTFTFQVIVKNHDLIQCHGNLHNVVKTN